MITGLVIGGQLYPVQSLSVNVQVCSQLQMMIPFGQMLMLKVESVMIVAAMKEAHSPARGGQLSLALLLSASAKETLTNAELSTCFVLQHRTAVLGSSKIIAEGG
eukprot:TRINITY_DN10503_c4_g2_i2.p2 TRINITY_DN10503_c4_g2~~TRINITY_DN10503_c4_g2_i2.p2  ORF type:complete len:105 (+),score=17.46 TRINITY_DN10503_c4_g2_i2:127-441(+)